MPLTIVIHLISLTQRRNHSVILDHRLTVGAGQVGGRAAVCRCLLSARHYSRCLISLDPCRYIRDGIELGCCRHNLGNVVDSLPDQCNNMHIAIKEAPVFLVSQCTLKLCLHYIVVW